MELHSHHLADFNFPFPSFFLFIIFIDGRWDTVLIRFQVTLTNGRLLYA